MYAVVTITYKTGKRKVAGVELCVRKKIIPFSLFIFFLSSFGFSNQMYYYLMRWVFSIFGLYSCYNPAPSIFHEWVISLLLFLLLLQFYKETDIGSNCIKLVLVSVGNCTRSIVAQWYSCPQHKNRFLLIHQWEKNFRA